MPAASLLTHLRARGLRLWRHGDELRVAPRALLDESDRAALGAHTAALLGLLDDLEQLERDGTAARLRAVAATLTPEEHHRLAAEAAGGDRLAALVQVVLTTSAGTEVA
jgi:hypothetical protein